MLSGHSSKFNTVGTRISRKNAQVFATDLYPVVTNLNFLLAALYKINYLQESRSHCFFPELVS